MNVLCHFVGADHDVVRDGLSAFDLDHGFDETDHLVNVFKVELRTLVKTSDATDGIYVVLCVVFCGWCPSCDDFGDGGALVVLDVPAHQDKGGTYAVCHGDELFEVGVCGYLDFA